MDNRPIGIFDSGLGGLTAVKALRRLLPEENIVFFGDTGRLPYGAKTLEQLRRMAVQDLDRVSACGVKAILAACGTLSSNTPELLDAYPVPTFGVLRSSVKAMSQTEKSGPLAVIATAASIRSGAFARALQQRCPEREILAVPCPDFVPLIESGHIQPDDALLRDAVARYLQPVRDAGAAALLLGCTHYGIIARALREYLGPETALVSAADCAARELAAYLEEKELCGGSGQERFLVSGSPAEFDRKAALLLGRPLGSPAEEVPVMEI